MPSPLPRVSRKGTPATPFGRVLLDQLDARAWTLADLARRIDRSEVYATRWLYEPGPPLLLCLTVAFALGIDCRDLLEAAGYPVARPVKTSDAQSASHERAHALIDQLPEAVVAVLVPMLDGLNKWEAGKG